MLNKCYLCGRIKPLFYFKKLGYSIYQCPFCHLFSLYLDRNYELFIRSYYTKGYFTGNRKIRAYANYQDDRYNIVRNASIILKKLKKIKKKGLILDVGCAMGFFMEEAEREGFISYGIEISKYAASIARKKFGRRIFTGSVEDFCRKWPQIPDFENLKFEVIVLSDIIEHLKDPRMVLSNLRNMLKNDGVIIIQTGDADSFWARLMKKNWHFFAPPQHLYFFSRRTLNILLKQSGYQTINVYKEGKYVSLRYILHMTQYMNIPKIGDHLGHLIANTSIGRISFLIKLFDNMVVFAKKE